MRYLLIIAGSDSIGGAGIQADIKTAGSLGVHALTVLTAATAQNALGIRAVHEIPPPFIAQQLEAVTGELTPHAVKVGMLYATAAVNQVASLVKRMSLGPLVLDPVMQASAGGRLLEPAAVPALKEELLPLAQVVTPNLDEAAALTGFTVEGEADMIRAAKTIHAMGPPYVVVTGGHLRDQCVDILFDGKRVHRFGSPKIATPHTHGSGCVFSTALAALMAQGMAVTKAAGLAHDYCRRAIGEGYACGTGDGSVRADIAGFFRNPHPPRHM